MTMLHPWDIDAVHKGFQLSPSEIEDITGEQFGTEAYRYAVMELSKRLERELRAVGRPCVVAEVRRHIRVLTDSESYRYSGSRQAKARKAIVKTHIQLIEVDTANLSEHEESEYNHLVFVSGCALQAERGCRAAIKRKVIAGTGRGGQLTP